MLIGIARRAAHRRAASPGRAVEARKNIKDVNPRSEMGHPLSLKNEKRQVEVHRLTHLKIEMWATRWFMKSSRGSECRRLFPPASPERYWENCSILVIVLEILQVGWFV